MADKETRDLGALHRAVVRLTRVIDGMQEATLLDLAKDFNGHPLSRLRKRMTLKMIGEGQGLPFGMTLRQWHLAAVCLELVLRKLLEPQPSGRRPDRDRLNLGERVLEVFQRHSLPVAKARDGMFARTLGLVLDAAGEQVPQDAFYLLKRIIDGAPPRRYGRSRKKAARR
jgi:hypothetical protein